MSRAVEKSLLEIDFASLRRGPFTPSPAAWEDQVLYHSSRSGQRCGRIATYHTVRVS